MNALVELREPVASGYGGGSGVGSDRRLLAVAVACLGNLRPAERSRIFGSLDGTGDFYVLSRDETEWIAGRRIPRAELDPRRALEEAEAFMRIAPSRGIGFVLRDDPGYPPLLREISDPPFALFVRGRLPDPGLPCVAIVGTRNPDMAAYAAARDLARELGGAGIPVVSGLALGIDAAAHSGALEAGGPTVAVLGCGIDSVYPRSNSGLAARILRSGGAIVSEYPPGREPLKHRFPERNRIISGLSRTVVVAQAPEKSGALITADFALEQGRDLLVLDSCQGGERSAGTKALAEQGAMGARSLEDIEKAWRGNA